MDEDTTVPLFAPVNIFLHSVSSTDEVNINIRICNSNGLSAHKTLISENF